MFGEALNISTRRTLTFVTGSHEPPAEYMGYLIAMVRLDTETSRDKTNGQDIGWAWARHIYDGESTQEIQECAQEHWSVGKH